MQILSNMEDIHKSLYKERSQFLSPRRHNILNRQKQEANRTRQRNDRFQNSRNISPEIHATENVAVVEIRPEEKENTDQQNINSSCLLVVKTTNPKKLTRQEEFLKRYIEWKENEKKNKLKNLKDSNKKKPFLSAVSSERLAKKVSSFVPRGHHKEFRPPIGLKDPLLKAQASEKDEEPPKPVIKGRQSMYTVQPTPPRKTKQSNEKVNKFPISRNAFPTNLNNASSNQKHSAPAVTRNALKSNATTPMTSGKSTLNLDDRPSTSAALRQAISNQKPSASAATRNALKSASKTPLPSEKLTLNLDDRPSTSAAVRKALISSSKTTLTSKKLTNKTPEQKKAPIVKRNSAKKSAAKLAAANLVKSFERSAAAATKFVDKTKLKPRALKMPPPPKLPPSKAPIKKLPNNKNTNELPTKATAPLKQGGAVGKIKTLQAKRAVESVKSQRKSPLKSGGARLGQNLKAKKNANSSKIKSVPSLQLNGKTLLNLANQNQASDTMILQTPKDFANLNPFEEFVTSTKIRDTSLAEEHADGRKESFSKLSQDSSSAKRKLLQDVNSTTTDNSKQIETNSKNNSDGLQKNVGKKYNFMRYSEANLSLEDKSEQQAEDVETLIHENDVNNTITFKKNKPDEVENVGKKYNFMRYSQANVSMENNQDNVATKEKVVTSDEETNKTLVQTSPVEEDKTPTKSGPEERPSNYLSPYVSVTRGKVSLKKEKEKRNSIYLQNPLENVATQNPAADAPTYSVEVRRTLEAVRYFRKQLDDEIARLHKLSDIWEVYKDENSEQIQNANGEDMINVTIGQTRLLTSKKFMQFKGLIDRCESGATGINAVEYDGSEKTRAITAVDLEGFWSMLGIQVDNLDKRFDNLNRWKLNDWQDPDEVKTKIKKNLTKVKKAKATATAKVRPSSALQQMLRNMRKNKNLKNDAASNNDVVLTPSKQKNVRRSANNSTPRKSIDTNNSPRRLSIVVKDRKYYSPAQTVISVSSPSRRSSIMQRKTSQDSPKILKHIQAFNEVFDNVLSSSSTDLRKSALINGSINSRRLDRKTSLDSPKSRENANKSEELRKSNQSPFNSPVLINGRKSILKTPGTAKSRQRNVIFNEKLRVKKFNFMLDDTDQTNVDDEDTNRSHEEDLAKSHDEETEAEDAPLRTLTLRNRRVKLRPSCEIVIPGKTK